MRGKKLFLLAAMCIAIFLLCTACGATEVDISQFVKVTFDGLDGSGTAVVTTTGLDSAIESIIIGEDGTFEDAILKYDAISAVEDAVKVELDKEDGLSNGDTVTVNITVDNDTAKEYGVNFVGVEPLKFDVSDLQEITEIDPFAEDVFNIMSGDGVYIDFTGISPRAGVQIRNTLPSINPLSEVTYTVEGNIYNNVKKGQDVTIVASAPYDWEDKGYVLTSNKTTVKCENVAEYITSLDEIDDATWGKIKKQCEDLKKSKIDAEDTSVRYKNNEGVTRSVSDIESTENFKYSKDYFLSLKDGLDSSYMLFGKMDENAIFISYDIDLKGVPEGLSFKSDRYDVNGACGCFVVADLVKDKDGNIQFTADQVSIEYYIYTDEETMKISEINEYLDKFELSESDSKLKK